MNNNQNSVSCDCVTDNSCVNSVCDSMLPADILLALALECPRGRRSGSCTIKEVEKWRQMGLKQAYILINNLTLDEQKRLVEKHRQCSSINPYSTNSGIHR